jgi:putative acetyltransferase
MTGRRNPDGLGAPAGAPLHSGRTIRPARPGDDAAVRDMIARAFAPMPFADGNEANLPGLLAAAGALSLSLVADDAGRVIGHLALSPATHDSGAGVWFALGPLAVAPGSQRQRVGTALIRAANHWLDAQGAAGCIVLGDTRYYPRHGFLPAPHHAPVGLPAEHFMVRAASGAIPAGRFRFHPVFDTPIE